MRRFPPPPGGNEHHQSTPIRRHHASSTSRDERRSTEAPMEYEWQQPRSFPPDSPFRNAVGSGGMGLDHDGERAKKRSHYEAMDVDTPPRPFGQASFPPEATTSLNPFGFGVPTTTTNTSSTSAKNAAGLDFDADTFDAKEALGLGGEGDVSVADMSIEETTEISKEGKEVSLLGVSGSSSSTASSTTSAAGAKASTRRRRGGSESRKSSGRSLHQEKEEHAGTDDEDDDDDEQRYHQTTRSSHWKPPTKSNFSFQVHHHHNPNAGSSHQFDEHGYKIMRAPATGKWLNSGTPYVLLGYLQFLSLALLAILFLSLSGLFIYTLYVDIQSRLRSLTSELRAEILACAKMYVDNRCEPGTRLPALERKCAGWEECMGREIVVVGKTRVVAETLAEVVNGFVDVISFKTMFFVILTLGLCIYGSSIALSLLPSRPNAVASHQSPPQFPSLGYYPSQLPPGYGYLPASSNVDTNRGQQWMQMGSTASEKSGGLGDGH